jgi:hypothetical protein
MLRPLDHPATDAHLYGAARRDALEELTSGQTLKSAHVLVMFQPGHCGGRDAIQPFRSKCRT